MRRASHHLPFEELMLAFPEEDPLQRHWRVSVEMGGGASPLPTCSHSPFPSEQLHLLQRSHSQAPKMDSVSVQSMIESNRKWLEHVKNDPKVYPFSWSQSFSPCLL